MSGYAPIHRIGKGGERRVGGYVLVSDVARSMRWYKETLDLSGYPYPSEEPHFYANLRAGNLELSFVLMDPKAIRHAIPEARTDEISPCVVMIHVDDVAQLEATVKDRVPIHTPLGRDDNGRLRFAIEDPDHHLLVFQEVPQEAG